jgi:hypothetical protein
MSIFERLANHRLWPLFVKELRQIARNRRLVISLIIPPLSDHHLRVCLNPRFTNLRLGWLIAAVLLSVVSSSAFVEEPRLCHNLLLLVVR